MLDHAPREGAMTPRGTTRSPAMLDKINAIEVAEDAMADGARAIAAMDECDRGDFDRRMLALIDALKRRHPGVNIPLTALAIDFRLRALCRLLETQPVQGCHFDPVTRLPALDESALRAAVRERLRPNGAGLASFDADGFRARLRH